MSTFARTDRSLISSWWWTVDRWSLAAIVAICAIGAVLTLAASPPVAERLGFDTYYFVRHQFLYLTVALVLMTSIALMSPRTLRRIALAVFVCALIATALVPIIGYSMNGATRWIRVPGMSLQPSEFLKPSFAIVAAWLFARRGLDERFPGFIVATGLMGVIGGLMLLQPDVGMTIVITAVWSVQLFLAGLSLWWVGCLGILAVVGAVGAYFTFSHVQARVDIFLNPGSSDNYQVTQALQAFHDGGLFGRGPGEGIVKQVLPDAHADFVFAVAGEEFGLILCLVVVGLFAFVVLRGFARVLRENDLFNMLAVAGLLVQFGLQSLINMASTTNLIPPKGMTLPFVSYGGSSALSLAFTVGMVLALTRERHDRGIAA